MLYLSGNEIFLFSPRGEETSVTLNDLKPAMDYHAK